MQLLWSICPVAEQDFPNSVSSNLIVYCLLSDLKRLHNHKKHIVDYDKFRRHSHVKFVAARIVKSLGLQDSHICGINWCALYMVLWQTHNCLSLFTLWSHFLNQKTPTFSPVLSLRVTNLLCAFDSPKNSCQTGLLLSSHKSFRFLGPWEIF